MKSTAQILEEMNGNSFELLCGPVLHRMIPELANLLPSGTNAEGQTIKSLSDGFCFIEGKHFATMHVTANSSNLRTKWLYDGEAKTTPKGDLIKGISKAREMHTTNPDSQYSIFLVSSHRVEEDLHIEVNQTITDDFIKVRIIEQRNLVNFLDLDPEGQWLRKHLLGIDAERISASLLMDIAKENLGRYAKEIYLEEQHLADISGIGRMKQQLVASASRINLLTAESGLGKSTACYALMRTTLELGVIALRISPFVIEKAVSLEDAILQQLIIDYPKLYAQPSDIRLLFVNALVIIDDINKSPHANTLLDKIISWGEPRIAGSYTVLCPVWPRNLDSLENRVKKDGKYVLISLGRLSFYDCKEIIEQRIGNALFPLTDQQIHALIVDTGFDPLLLDLSLNLLANKQTFSSSAAGDAISKFVMEKIRVTHESSKMPVHLIMQTLVKFGKKMLNCRLLIPCHSDIENWLGKGTEEIQVINAVANQRQLFYFGDDGKIYFRHDRILDHILVMAAIDLLKDCLKNKDVLVDPYYAEIVGEALAISLASKDALEILIQENPVAVYSSLKYLQDHPDDSRLLQTIEICETWSIAISVKHIPNAITNTIANTLISFDVKDIERITKGFPNSLELQLAKFRNGIWLSGIKFFSFMDYFFPGSPNYWWYSVLAHVKMKHLGYIIADLQKMLPASFTPEAIPHAYTLVGFFKEPKLLKSLTRSWAKYASPVNYVSYLWAVLNSFTANDTEVIRFALSYFNTLSEQQKHQPIHRLPQGGSMIREIEHVNWEFSEEQLCVLIELSKDENLHEILAPVFAYTDHPKALEIVLNIEMKREEDMYWNEYRDERWDIGKKRPKLSEASLDYLLREFTDVSNQRMRRYIAWRFWSGNSDAASILKKMQEFDDKEDPLFFHIILWRIHHHDHSAFRDLTSFITTKPWLVRIFQDVWNLEVAEFFEGWFSQKVEANSMDEIAYGIELLEHLDNDFAVRLLIRHWDILKGYPKGISLALFFSRPETIALADKEIRRLGFEPGKNMPQFYYGNMRGTYISWDDGMADETKKDLLILSRLFSGLELNYGTKYAGKPERLTRKKIETLLPYLELMNNFTLSQFAKKCLAIGAPDLCYDKFFPLIRGYERTQIKISTDDIKRELSRKLEDLERENSVYMERWIENPKNKGVTHDMVTEALQFFLADHKNAKAFFIASLVLERIGRRKDIELMEGFTPDSKTDLPGVLYSKRNAVFLIKRRTLI